MNACSHRLDVTDVTDRAEIASAFGDVTAWRCAVKTYTVREAKEKDRRRKRHLRLMLLNAQTQLAVAIENEASA